MLFGMFSSDDPVRVKQIVEGSNNLNVKKIMLCSDLFSVEDTKRNSKLVHKFFK